MPILNGSCHCGAVEFTVETEEDGLQNLRRCNCSLCRRKGTLMASVPEDKLIVTKGEDTLTLYQWNLKIAKHYFCSVCGIYPFHRPRSAPDTYGFNVGCIEGVDPYSFTDVPVRDGASLSLAGDPAS
ncbi:GFA family protein [Oricola nitratireducens]|uniref:GFA family protein n=1 Tax=Oricola nitratireducens TaxID=2775868 RepID=UPI001868B2F6|nr:GFA family protein [Oricola nitratireducens]